MFTFQCGRQTVNKYTNKYNNRWPLNGVGLNCVGPSVFMWISAVQTHTVQGSNVFQSVAGNLHVQRVDLSYTLILDFDFRGFVPLTFALFRVN